MDEDLKNFIEQQLPDNNLQPIVRGEEHLPFDKISPRAFDVLCCKLANALFVDARLYGTPGQTQEGIDIACFGNNVVTESNAPPKHIRVFFQCKRVKKIQVYDLNQAVKKFSEGEFGQQSGKFILCIFDISQARFIDQTITD